MIPLLAVAVVAGALVLARRAAPDAAHSAPGSYYVGFVPPAFTSPFHVMIAAGARAEAAAKGWTIDVQAAASEGDFAGQVTIVEQLIEKGVQAISINPINVDAMTAGVKAAADAHIPVFMHNFITPLSDPTAKVTAYIGYDQFGGAEKLGKYTCRLLAKKFGVTPEAATGKVYILLGIDSIFSHRRTDGYKAGLTMCPGVKVVGQQTAEWTREKGASVATAALQQFPDIDVFYGNSDEMAIGAALAAESLGLVINKDFYAIAIDGNQPTLDLIRQGKFTATLGVDPFHMGQVVIDAIDAVLHGGTVPQFILTPSVIVDASNLDDYVAGRTWMPPVAGSAEIDNGLPTVNR